MNGPRSRRSPQNRRRFPRLQVLGLVDGYLMPLDVPLTVIDLSTGGFSVRSASPFPPGSRHHFRFTLGHDQEVTVDATVVHCRLTQAGSGADAGQVAYVSGLEFVSNTRSDEAVAVLIDTLSSVFSLE